MTDIKHKLLLLSVPVVFLGAGGAVARSYDDYTDRQAERARAAMVERENALAHEREMQENRKRVEAERRATCDLITAQYNKLPPATRVRTPRPVC